jgi:hypothetical protein
VLDVVLVPDNAAFLAGGMLIYLLHRDGHDLGTWLLLGLQAVVSLYQIAPAYIVGSGRVRSPSGGAREPWARDGAQDDVVPARRSG